MSKSARVLAALRTVGRFLAWRWTRYAAAWALALGLGWWVWEAGYNYYDNPNRPDGTGGHTTIDFGGSYIMGRMLVTGNGKLLYDRMRIRNVVREAYPRADEDPSKAEEKSEADWFLSWFMGYDRAETGTTYASCASPLAAADPLGAAALAAAGYDEAWKEKNLEAAAAHTVGGPLYPPVNAIVSYPFSLLRPAEAYRLHQILDIGLTVLAAWGVCVIARGKIWLPAALAILVVFPGYHGAHLLAQNSILTLTILVWGWVLIARGREGWGGVVWGLMAFKPVWAVAFFVTMVLTRRWRGAFTMGLTGAAQIALTLPLVGVDSWLDWWKIGRDAAAWYNIEHNWIRLSRDLLSMPRRYMLDFKLDWDKRDTLEATIAGWVILVLAFEVTARFAALRPVQARQAVGPGAAFMLIGGWLCCFHFMYYDALLAYLPVMLLFHDPAETWRQFARPQLVRRVEPEWVPPGGGGYVLHVASRWAYGWIANPFPALALAALLFFESPGPTVIRYLGLAEEDIYSPPTDTWVLILLWLWCAWVSCRREAPAPAAAPAAPSADGVAVTQALPQPAPAT